MANNFWLTLPRPFSVLAPMYDVTDAAFRHLIATYSRPTGPDVFITEFVSADGLMSPQGGSKLRRELYFTTREQPVVAQIFGSQPEKICGAARLARDLGFSGVDINMGCPDRAVMKQGAGIALCHTPSLAQEIIAAAQEGAGDLPVSVKTRLGYSRPEEWLEWLGTLLAAKPALITIHLRTMKELSQVPAHWELSAAIAGRVQAAGVLCVANGDIPSPAEGLAQARANGLDGYMLGRGVFGRPWLWSGRDVSVAEVVQILREHIILFNDLYGQTKTNQKLFAGHGKNFAVMKKHFKAYLKGSPQFSQLRLRLMDAPDAATALALLADFDPATVEPTSGV